ncbi:MAG: ribosomal-processing cysteine protease Prp [Erysipelotrichaceae bacterium]
MITISVYQSVDLIKEVKIKGHAQAADAGEDLVCAGVSSIAIGTLNALDLLSKNTCDARMQQACIHINVNCMDDNRTQIILQTMLIQLSTMEERYPENIKIKKQEV